MYPYIEFFDSEEIGYTEDMRENLLAVAKGLTGFAQYESLDGTIIQLEHRATPFVEFEITKAMRNLIQPQVPVTAATFLKLNPGTHVPIHLDNHLLRSTVLSFPLTPEPEHFAPTLFYENESSTIPIEVGHWHGRPGAINTREYHAAYNNRYTRIKFQLCFEMMLDEFMTLYHSGELFRTQLGN